MYANSLGGKTISILRNGCNHILVKYLFFPNWKSTSLAVFQSISQSRSLFSQLILFFCVLYLFISFFCQEDFAAVEQGQSPVYCRGKHVK